MKNKTIITILVLIFAGLIVYNLPYFAEKRAYSKAKKENSDIAYTEYLTDYKDSEHADEITFLQMKLRGFDLTNINDFIVEFPKSTFLKDVYIEYDKLWDKEIAKFNAKDKEGIKPQALNFMNEMLQYMKKNHINSILIETKSTLSLKDYDEYDSSVREIIESFSESDLPLKGNVVSLKSNFTSDDIDQLDDVIIDGLNNSFDKLFSPGFFEILSANNLEHSTDLTKEKIDHVKKLAPRIEFNYQIKSQEQSFLGETFPDIWTYYKEDFGTGTRRTQSYLIGIDIKFNTHFSIPNSTTAFDFTDNGEPDKEINNIEDIAHGYRKMTNICFQHFTDKISKNLGLDEFYYNPKNNDNLYESRSE